MNAYKNASFAGIVILILGIIVSIYGFSWFLYQENLDENGLITTGIVVDINEKDFYRSPIVTFTTQDSQEVSFLSKLDVNVDLFQYEIGQEVEVIYDPSDPQQTAEVNAYWERNTAHTWSGVVGVFMIIFGFFWRRHMLNKAEKYETRLREASRS